MIDSHELSPEELINLMNSEINKIILLAEQNIQAKPLDPANCKLQSIRVISGALKKTVAGIKDSDISS